MPRMLFLAMLICLSPLAAYAEEDAVWGNDDEWSVKSIHDDTQLGSIGFADEENGDLLREARDDNDDHRHDDSEIGNGFGGTSSKSMGSIVSDQLKPASGR